MTDHIALLAHAFRTYVLCVALKKNDLTVT